MAVSGSGLGIIWILNVLNVYKSTSEDVGYYLLAWALYTLIMFVASLRVHKAMSVTFFLLLVGFILLVVGHFSDPCFQCYCWL